MSKRTKWILVGLIVPIAAWIAYINFPRTQLQYSTIPMNSSVDDRANESTNSETEANEPTAAALPFSVSLVYSPSYLIDIGGLERMHPFDIKKYQKIQDALIGDNLCEREHFLSPPPLSDEDLLLIHTPAYLTSLESRSNVAAYLQAPILMLAPVSLETAILQPFRHASGGTLMAARTALRNGIAINIGGGYHHAKPDKGEGFCLFADVPIAIRRLQKEKLIQRAIVIDVDVHQGNGTIVCLPNDETTFTFSMHQTGIYPMPKEKGDVDIELHSGMNDDQYLTVLKKCLPDILDQAAADICFVVGGCDTLQGDPLASLQMTHEGIVRRDQIIIDACVSRSIPVVFTLSGGYSKNAWQAQYKSIKNLIEKQGLAAPDSSTD